MEIQIRTNCTRCNGDGVYQHPAWEAFEEAHPHHKDKPVPAEQIIQWMEQNHFAGVIQTRTFPEIEKEGQPTIPAVVRKHLPGPDFQCSKCGGVGKVYKWAAIAPELIKVEEPDEEPAP